jgi:hypothetical protein
MPYVGPRWLEEWDPAQGAHYYINMESAETQWLRPSEFDQDGVKYESEWSLRWDFEHQCVYYFHPGRSERHEYNDRPAGFDGRPLHEYWVFMTRKQILQEQRTKVATDANDRALGIRGSKVYRNTTACAAALQPPKRTSERIIEEVGEGADEEVFYVNTVTGDVSNSAPPCPPCRRRLPSANISAAASAT